MYLYKRKKRLDNNFNNRSFGSLTEDLRQNNSIYSQTIYQIRIFFSIIFLLFLRSHTIAQTISFMIFSVFVFLLGIFLEDIKMSIQFNIEKYKRNFNGNSNFNFSCFILTSCNISIYTNFENVFCNCFIFLNYFMHCN